MESGKGTGPLSNSGSRMRVSVQTLRWALLPVLLALFFSCKTPPVVEEAPDLGVRLQRSGQTLGEGAGRFDRLGNDALIYAWMDAKRMAPLLESVLPAIPGLDKTLVKRGRDLAFAAYPAIKKDDRHFMLDAAGSWPSFGMSLSFTFSPEWKRIKAADGSKYWRSSRYSLSFDASRLLASDVPGFPSPAEVAIPQVVAGLSSHTDFVLWMNNPLEALLSSQDSIPAATRLLVSRMTMLALALEKETADTWRAGVHIPLQSEREARAVAALLRLALRAVGSISDLVTQSAAALAPDAKGTPLPPEARPDAFAALLALFAGTEVSIDGQTVRLESRHNSETLAALLYPLVSVYFTR